MARMDVGIVFGEADRVDGLYTVVFMLGKF